MNKIITIDGKKYRLDVGAAISRSLMLEILPVKDRSIQIGDVFISRRRINHNNPFVLVQALYDTGHESKRFQLLGIGCAPNSGGFFNSLHSIDEIREYLEEQDMQYSHSIQEDVYNLVNQTKV